MRKNYNPEKSQIYVITEMMSKFGRNVTLGDVFDELTRECPYKCPKCAGRGYVKVEYNGYPSGLPDSGFVYEAAYRDEKCNLCNGTGWTKVKMKPKLVQDGWEEE